MRRPANRAERKPTMLFKIGDFSKLSLVPVKTLRYYDEMELLQPVEVDRFTGYRYYSVDQLPRLNRILALKDLGFSLQQIAQALDEGITTEQLRGMLRLKQAEQQQRVQEEQERLDRVAARLSQIEKETAMSHYDVVLKQIEPQRYAALRKTLAAPQQIGGLFEALFGYLGRQGVRPAGPPGAVWHDLEYHEDNVDTEALVPIGEPLLAGEGIQVTQLPAAPTTMACAIHQGSYEGFGQAYNSLMGWISANGYRMAGPIREFYLRGPGPEPTDPNSYVTEIQVPVEKAPAAKA